MYWFYHEYLDEERRFRIHRVDSETEQEARRLHRLACNFDWVTHHVEPTVSSLFVKTEGGQRALVQGHRPGQPYHTDFRPVPMPDDVREMLFNYRSQDEAALSGVRASDDRNAVLAAPAPARTPAAKDGLDTPF
jgi:hypothetical protein